MNGRCAARARAAGRRSCARCEVLPLVPVMWMTGKARCGSPSRLTRVAIRSRVGSIDDSAGGRRSRARPRAGSRHRSRQARRRRSAHPSRLLGRGGGRSRPRGAGTWAAATSGVMTQIRFRPAFLAWYSAASAAASSSSRSCRGLGQLGHADGHRDADQDALVPAVADGDRRVGDVPAQPLGHPLASGPVVRGSRIANSSPPNRPIRSPSRSWALNRSATTRRTRSPARWP